MEPPCGTNNSYSQQVTAWPITYLFRWNQKQSPEYWYFIQSPEYWYFIPY